MSQPRHILTPAEWVRMASVPAPPLLALWADTREVYALLHDAGAPRLVSCEVAAGGYPALSPVRPAAVAYERMIHDLWGHAAIGGLDARPWLDHGNWPHATPMSPRPGPPGRGEPPEFGIAENLDQVPIGPVRGDFAPVAHLRLGVPGETVVRMETRLGYTHKGTLMLMRGKTPRAAARFAARLAGETTVAHAIAFARATEDALDCEIPPRASAWRGVMAELERITCHLDVVATMAEAVGLPVMATLCARHGEALRRVANQAFGHRLMMDCVVPGGVAGDVPPGGAEAIERVLVPLAAELAGLARLPLERRLSGCAVVTPAQAALFPGVLAGDAAARARARLDAIGDSVRLVRNRLAMVPEGAISVQLPVASAEGLGFAEGPNGDVWHWLRLDHAQIASVFMRDPAWLYWPLLEVVMAQRQIDDLSLVLASFGLTGSGVDL